MSREFVFRILFVVYISLVVFLSTYSFKETEIDFSAYILFIRTDHLIHFIMFFPYPFSAWLALREILLRNGFKRPLLAIFLSGILLALLAEGLQGLISSRDFDITDLIANLSSITVSTLFVKILEPLIDNVWPCRLQ